MCLIHYFFCSFHTLLHCVSCHYYKATGALLVRMWLQLCRVLQATSAHRVVQLQSPVHQEPTRTERNRQPAMSVRRVGALFTLFNFSAEAYISCLFQTLLFSRVPFLFCWTGCNAIKCFIYWCWGLVHMLVFHLSYSKFVVISTLNIGITF